MNPEEVSRVASLSEDDLLDELAKAIEPQSLGMEEKDRRKAGENWLQRNKRKLAELVCAKPVVVGYLGGSSHSTDIELITEIGDLISVAFHGYPVFTIAALLVKRGLHVLCGNLPPNATNPQ